MGHEMPGIVRRRMFCALLRVVHGTDSTSRDVTDSNISSPTKPILLHPDSSLSKVGVVPGGILPVLSVFADANGRICPVPRHKPS